MESAGCEAVGPSSPHKDGPLTPFGIKVVERMNELGMVLDVAHAKIETLKGIAEITKAPLIDSHTKHCSHIEISSSIISRVSPAKIRSN